MSINNGIILVNKPRDISSYDVIRQLKKQLQIKKLGHSGTLDPIAEGLLVIGVNKGTKLLNLLPKDQKKYYAVVKMGIETDTLDITGKIIGESKVDITLPQLQRAINKFRGEIEQIPPKYSAKKINGIAAYKLARNDQDFELKSQKITIHEIKLVDFHDDEFSFEVTVSYGTYIRSLINDICNELGIKGTMKKLIRLENNGFNLEDAKNIDEITTNDIIDINKYINNHYTVYETNNKIIQNGGKIHIKDYNFPCAFSNNGKIIAIYDIYENNYAKPILMI